MHCIHISIWNMLSKASCKLLRSWKLIFCTSGLWKQKWWTLNRQVINCQRSISRILKVVFKFKDQQMYTNGFKGMKHVHLNLPLTFTEETLFRASVCLPRCDETRGPCKVKRRRQGILTDGSMRVEDFVRNLFGAGCWAPHLNHLGLQVLGDVEVTGHSLT